MTPSFNAPIHQTIHPTISGGVSTDSHLQTELNYLNLFKTYCIFSNLGVPPWSGTGWVCGGVGGGVGGWGNRIERIGFVQ